MKAIVQRRWGPADGSEGRAHPEKRSDDSRDDGREYREAQMPRELTAA